MHVQIFTQFLTVSSQHRLVLDRSLRYFIIFVFCFQLFILSTESHSLRKVPSIYLSVCLFVSVCLSTVCGEKRPSLTNIIISVNIFYNIFRDYSRHNSPLLLQILSSHLSLFKSSRALNIKDDFLNCTDK